MMVYKMFTQLGHSKWLSGFWSIDFQIWMWAGSNCHYTSMSLRNEIFKTFAVLRLVTAFLVTCENADVQ